MSLHEFGFMGDLYVVCSWKMSQVFEHVTKLILGCFIIMRASRLSDNNEILTSEHERN